MKKRKKILVPVDFSLSSENAFRHAILTADKLEAEITLIHVVNPDVAVVEVPIAVEIAVHEQMKIAKQKLYEITSNIMAQVLQLLQNVPVVLTEIELGNPFGAINRYAKTNNFDFIFMGTRNKHGAVDKIFGSVASNVIKNAPCPVMVIPEFAVYRDTTLVTYATDLEEVDPYEIWNVAKLLKPFHPIIRCVHFNENERDLNSAINMSELKAFFSENAAALQITFHEISTENKEESMLEFLETFDTNLLVAYRPERRFWKNLFHKSFTKKMALETKVPFLVLRKK